MSFKIPDLDLEYNFGLMKIIEEHGKNLRSINLLIANENGFPVNLQTSYVLEYISEGCPKLKSLTLGPDMWDLEIDRESLEELYKGHTLNWVWT